MSVCWKYIKESLVYLVSVTENWCKKMCYREKKNSQGHLDNLSARVYFGNGKERLSRRMETSDWQVTLQCLFTPSPPFFTPFFYPFFASFLSLSPFPPLPVRLLVYLVWQQHLNSISL